MTPVAPTPETPEPTVLVRMLESVGPTATDRQRYEAGTEWHVPLARAEALEAAGLAELLDTLDAPAPDSDPAEE